MTNYTKELEATASLLATPGKGILAADESTPTITKRFQALHIDATEESRRKYRDMLMSAPNIEQYIAGVILYEETLFQNALCGIPFPALLNELGILPGIKVDKGLIPLAHTEDEQVTQGLDGLPERLAQYKEQGARFAKWRAVYRISDNTPSTLALKTNAEVLARYAAICQTEGIVPIVEPEVLLEGDHTIARCEEVTEAVLVAVFKALHRHHVALEHIVLKPSMVINGKACPEKARVEEVAMKTVRVLRQTVPATTRTINFLSGGQTAEEASAHLNAMNQLGFKIWPLSFSYARALQEPAMKVWAGSDNNIRAAQMIFVKRAQLNSLASLGQYNKTMETEKAVLV
ncbi:MAG: fructose-bisphosphate aldolase [Gammaproteobacteria bacterium RIFCSPHIGHO2_12_FULL_42_10]|nr:MAG: fructose-bisphosphate aldolase [Gammaproteobacteria bacterium RIFCSPHIGHO2_12_FULL_42_10]